MLKIMGFFVPCVWLVPFLLFISLSVNDSILPTGLPSSGSVSDGKKQSLVKSIFGFFGKQKDSVLLHHTASFENYSGKRDM